MAELKLSDYKTTVHNDWCPGCGDFGILNAIQMALSEMQIPRHKAVIFSGIGCSGKTPHFINVYGIHTLHGRVLPFAQGAKIANPDLEIIAVGGDGDGLGIGAGHFVGAGRKNVDIPYLIFNNEVYGLTKGQASPTLRLGEKTKSLVSPNTSNNVNPIALAFVSGFTFIARSYSYDVKHLKDIIKRAVTHKGLAFVDVLQPCPTYDDIHTREWFQGKNKMEPNVTRPRIYKIEETGYNGTIANESEINEKMSKILEFSTEWGDKIPIGIFYQNELVPSYHERIAANIEDYFSMPPSHQTIMDTKSKSSAQIDKILDKFQIND